MNELPQIWDYGQLLAFSGMDGTTAFEDGLCMRTARGDIAFELKNTDPNCRAMIHYSGSMPDKIELTGDFFGFYAGKRISRGVFCDAWNLLLEGDFRFSDLMPYYELLERDGKFLLAVKGRLHPAFLDAPFEKTADARLRFLRSVPELEGVSENSRKTICKALSQLKTQIYSPEGMIRHYWSTPDRWPHRQMWLWDSAFHAIGMRHYDPALARDLISSVFDLQQENGFIPLCGSPSFFYPTRTQPPVLGLAMKLVNEIDPCPAWIGELAPKLARFIRWIAANRDVDGDGLAEWAVEGNADCRSGESGMDNSPRFDEGFTLDAPDFNAFIASECEILAGFLPGERDFWLSQHKKICKLMNQRLWSPEHRLYEDYDHRKKRLTGVLSSAGFLPLLCGAPDAAQAAAMAAHLTDPDTFGTPLRVPSIAANNVLAYKKDMWRGPVWININYLIALGLERYGFYELAGSIVNETLREMEKWYLQCGTFFEFYDDRKEVEPRMLERKGKMPPGQFLPGKQPFHDYGWSADLYLEMIGRLH